MTSKEALEFFVKNIDCDVYEFDLDKVIKHKRCLEQDLERLEQLEDNIKIHKETIKMQHSQIESLQSENKKLNKQLDVFFNKLDKNTIRALDLISYDLYDENSKLKKVIEILADKKVSKFWIVMSESVDRYNAVMGKNYILTQEEYDLLKVWLCPK